ncbi:MAG: hypothetical protein AB1806_03840 [Acidobacteriota bacterium]
MTNTTLRSSRGLSLIETTVVLSVLTVLTSTLAPAVHDYVVDARGVKARSDMDNIAVAVARLAFDVPAARARTWAELDVLVGAGEIPGADAAGTEPWLATVDSGRAATLDDHLVTNQPGFARRTAFGGSLVARGWAGPYLTTGVGPDPWGNRYAVSVGNLAGDAGLSAVVISAGPNGRIETPFGGRGAAPESDDLVVTISGGRR